MAGKIKNISVNGESRAVDVEINKATQSQDGLMSKEDKVKLDGVEVKTATSLPSTLADNTIYDVGSKTGTLSIPTAPTSVKGIRINFTVTGGAFAITFADTPKWMDEAPELALENGNYTICILDGIYSLNKLV